MLPPEQVERITRTALEDTRAEVLALVRRWGRGGGAEWRGVGGEKGEETGVAVWRGVRRGDEAWPRGRQQGEARAQHSLQCWAWWQLASLAAKPVTDAHRTCLPPPRAQPSYRGRADLVPAVDRGLALLAAGCGRTAETARFRAAHVREVLTLQVGGGGGGGGGG